MSFAQLTTSANRKLVNTKVRQIIAGLKQVKGSTGGSLKYNFTGLTLRLKDRLADYLMTHGTAIPGSANPDNRAWPTAQADWINTLAGISLNPAVPGTTFASTAIGSGSPDRWNKDTGHFTINTETAASASVTAHATAIAKGSKTLTSLMGYTYLIQVFQSGRVSVTSRLAFGTNPAGWNSDSSTNTELIGETTAGIVLTMALFSVECFYSKTVKATTATGSPATSGTGTGATQTVSAPFPYRTANALILVALDGTPGPND